MPTTSVEVPNQVPHSVLHCGARLSTGPWGGGVQQNLAVWLHIGAEPSRRVGWCFWVYTLVRECPGGRGLYCWSTDGEAS